jgi:hypothetical protein
MGMVAAVIASGVIGAGASVHNANTARDTATQGAQMADPAGPDRGFFRDWLKQNFMSLGNPDPNEILKNPNFQFMKQQGELGVMNNNVANFGSMRNGTLAEDMSKFNTGLASNFIGDQFQRNMQLMGFAGGLGGFSSGNLGASGQIMAGGGQNYFGNMNNAMGQLGQAGMFAMNNMGSFNPNTSYNANGVFTPYYTGGTPADPAYG